MELRWKAISTWSPRVVTFLFIAFLSLFSLDVFTEGWGFGEALLAFFIHNIPSLILGGILWAAWKRPIIGSYAYIGIAIIFSLWFDAFEGGGWMYLTLPPLVIAILYYLGHEYGE